MMGVAVVCTLSISLFQFAPATSPGVPVTSAPPLVRSAAVVPDCPPTKLTLMSAADAGADSAAMSAALRAINARRDGSQVERRISRFIFSVRSETASYQGPNAGGNKVLA